MINSLWLARCFCRPQESAFVARLHEFVNQRRGGEEAHRQPPLARGQSQTQCGVSLPGAGRAQSDDVLAAFDPFASGELEHLGLVQRGGGPGTGSCRGFSRWGNFAALMRRSMTRPRRTGARCRRDTTSTAACPTRGSMPSTTLPSPWCRDRTRRARTSLSVPCARSPGILAVSRFGRGPEGRFPAPSLCK